MSSQINTANPDQLTYQNEILSITVLGGIKLEGLDRMRATLKVELNGLPSPDGGITRGMRPAVRHNIDLYNDTQLEKLIRKVAERHEVGTSVVAATLAELTEQLETYRLQKIQEEEANSAPKVKILNPDEIEAAQAFLSKPNLLERTNELIGQSGVIGEGVNRLLMYLIFTSRKLPNPLHIVSLGASGTGKTHLQEKVGDLIPQEDKLEITVLSENAFYYFGQRELKHKLILIEDLDGAENALYPLRELQTKKRISKTVAHKNSRGETKTVHLVVEGPLSVAGCTTREQIYEDNANRSFLIYLDESKEQDERIMNYQRAASAGRVNKEAERKAAKILSNAQRVLEPILVVNPFAELLKLPAEIFKPRRTNGHYLQFIEVVTFYNQYQREKKARIEVEQLLEDSIRQLYERNVLLESQIVQIKNQQKSLIQQEKLALLGTLAAGVAHEINNPLAFVSSNVTTLNAYVSDLLNVIPKDSLNEADTRNINFIMSDLPELISDTEHGLVRIKDIVKNLLFFARTDADQLSEVDLLLAVEIALKLLGPKLKNVLVTQNLQPVPKIIFNSGELNQVLINILVNAIQACEYMTNHTSKIGVDLTQVNDEILLNVTDNGCGMSEEVQQRIFDAFYTTKPVGTGTGIGMSIVLQILEQHDAKIVVKSELNKGTSIQIYFPISTSM